MALRLLVDQHNGFVSQSSGCQDGDPKDLAATYRYYPVVLVSIRSFTRVSEGGIRLSWRESNTEAACSTMRIRYVTAAKERQRRQTTTNDARIDTGIDTEVLPNDKIHSEWFAAFSLPAPAASVPSTPALQKHFEDPAVDAPRHILVLLDCVIHSLVVPEPSPSSATDGSGDPGDPLLFRRAF
jgi:hypothetical protein